MDYSFNAEIAKRYGVNEAIFIQNLYFWINKNEANGRHYYEGRHWTYNSAKALVKLFPFWSEDQIKRLVRKMRDNGLIHIGNFNQKGMDRTNWYALSEEVLTIYHSAESPDHSAESPDGKGEIAPPIPDSKPDNKQQIYSFAHFWNEFPKKRSKGDAEKAFKALKPDDNLIQKMLNAIQAQKKMEDWQKDNGKYIPYPATWLRAKGWEDEWEDEIVSPDSAPQVWEYLP